MFKISAANQHLTKLKLKTAFYIKVMINKYRQYKSKYIKLKLTNSVPI